MPGKVGSERVRLSVEILDAKGLTPTTYSFVGRLGNTAGKGGGACLPSDGGHIALVRSLFPRGSCIDWELERRAFNRLKSRREQIKVEIKDESSTTLVGFLMLDIRSAVPHHNEHSIFSSPLILISFLFQSRQPGAKIS